MSATSHFWVLIHKHKDELQALGPVATFTAAAVAAGVAIRFGLIQARIAEGQRQIAAAQRDIAARRVQMDLHDRRYEILRAARSLMAEAFYERPDRIRMQELRRTLAQTRFFFPAHIAVTADEIDKISRQATHYGPETDPSSETMEKVQDALARLGELMTTWPAPFSEVMTFRDVE